MYDVRVERSAGYSGIAFVIVVVVAAFLPGIPPPPDAPTSTVMQYLDAHRSLWMLAAWLGFPTAAFFLWFVVQVRAYLRLAPQVDDGLGTYVLAGGVMAVTILMLISIAQILLGFRPAAELGASSVRVLYDLFNAAGAMIFVPTAIMTLGASNSGRRHGSLPSGLVFWGYLTTAGAAISTLSVFFGSGFLAMGGLGTVALGLFPFAIWVLWCSMVLIRAPRTGEKPA